MKDLVKAGRGASLPLFGVNIHSEWTPATQPPQPHLDILKP